MFKTTLIEPLYNLLVFLIDIIPGGDIGFAVIALTIVVRFLLYPLSASSIKTQIKMKEVDGEIKEIREKYKEDKQEQGKKLLEVYRKNEINPFSGILLLFIQIPVVIALYYVFAKTNIPNINLEMLYSFVPEPTTVKTTFLNFIDLTASKNALLAGLVGVTQYLQMHILINSNKKKEGDKDETQIEQMMRNMQKQMKIVLPAVSLIITFTLVSVVGLYWLVGNIFSIFQEIYIRKKYKR
jgi:YidC/Oxa1 family membrane protein insertase